MIWKLHVHVVIHHFSDDESSAECSMQGGLPCHFFSPFHLNCICGEYHNIYIISTLDPLCMMTLQHIWSTFVFRSPGRWSIPRFVAEVKKRHQRWGQPGRSPGFDKERCFLIGILRMVYHNHQTIYTPLYTQNKFCLLFMLVLVILPP